MSDNGARAAYELGRNFYGFEINKEYCQRAKEEMIGSIIVPKKEVVI